MQERIFVRVRSFSDDFRCQCAFSADEICLVAAAGPIDVRARLVDIRVERTSERTETAGRVRGVDVRKGKLLAGDSGRKIAEVIDLRGAIYQRGSREGGGEWCAGAIVHVHECFCTCVRADKWKG